MKLETAINDAENKIKGLTDREEGFVISRDGEILLHVTGGAHVVKPSASLVKDNIFTHNHPSGACALSLNDITAIIADDGYEVRAVTSDGRYASLTRGTSGWNPDIISEMDKAGLGGVPLFVKAANEATKDYGKNRTSKQILKSAENLVNDWLRQNAAKHGAIFKEGLI
jgi:hypothetical protein